MLAAQEKSGLVPWMICVSLVAALTWLLVARPLVFSDTWPETKRSGPIVLELFTSDGCSSCPPADTLLSEIGSSAKGVIPLAYHVDYWNHLGWSDPFSSHQFSDRQSSYARVMHGDVYTPQMVIEGESQCVGSDRGSIASGIAAAQKMLGRGRVSVSSKADAKRPRGIQINVSAQLPDGTTGSHQVMVAIFENGLESDIGAGENAGRKITYDYTVRKLIPALQLNSRPHGSVQKELTVALDPAWSIDHVGVAAFIQDADSLRILGAASQYPVAQN